MVWRCRIHYTYLHLLLCICIFLPGLAFMPVYLPSNSRCPTPPLCLSESKVEHSSNPRTKIRKTRFRKFEKMLPRLVAYKEKYGHTQVDPAVDGDLCKWTRQLRTTYRHQALNLTDSFDTSPRKSVRPKLSRAKLQALNDIGFDWSPATGYRRTFENMVSRLKAYKEKHGSIEVDPDIDTDLYEWIRQIRTRYRHQAFNTTNSSSNPRSSLSRNKMKELNDIGFDWGSQPTRTRTRSRSFDEMLPRLAAFQKKHGHTHVSKDEDEDLYIWTRNLRYNYLWQVQNWGDSTGKRRRLSTKKLRQLEDLGFSWETSRDWKRWPRMLKALTDYKEEYGSTHVDPEIDDDLYRWTQQIRFNYRHQALNMDDDSESSSKYRRPKLAHSKMQSLNDLDFDWSPPQRQGNLRWKDMIPRLQKFHEEHGHTRVPSDYADKELYRWTRNIITNYGRQLQNITTDDSFSGQQVRSMSSQRLEQLKELNFDWEQESSMWEQNYQELCDYKKIRGHCRVSRLESRRLGNFVQNQRQEFRRYLAGNSTNLTPDRIEALQQVNFDWARSHDNLWIERLEELEEFVKRAGTADVPQDYAGNYQLGQWTMNQRTKYRQRHQGKRSSLTGERIRDLEKLDFQWSIRQRRWDYMCERLRQYQEKYGHTEIPSSDVGNLDLRQWLNKQRYFYRNKILSRMSEERINKLEDIPGFQWRRPRVKGPSKKDWSDLFVAIREKGIKPGARARQHWFDGMDRFTEVKTEWSEDELLALWNEEDDDDDDEDQYFEDEESRLFLRA